MIARCTCQHEGQDKLYGKKLRVFNQTRKNEGKTWRCTVCLAEKTTGEINAKKKGKKK